MTPYPKSLERFKRVRQSRLSTFDACALQAHFEEEYRNHWTSHPAARGQIAHRGFARCLEEMSRQGEDKIEVDVALAILHEQLHQRGVDDFCHLPGCDLGATWDKAKQKVVCMGGHESTSNFVNLPMSEVKDLYWVTKKWAYDNTFTISTLVDVERRLSYAVVYDDPEGGFVTRELTGQIDAMFLDAEDDTHAIVIDWKDTWAIPPETEMSFEGYFQQRFYAWLIFRNYSTIQKVTLREFYVRYSEPREATITREMVDEIEAELSALVERFDQSFHEEKFPPSPGKHCQYCVRPTACPIPQFAKGEGRIVDEEQAKKQAARLIVAESVSKQARDALRAYADVHGPIPVKDAKGNTVWGFRESKRVNRPAQKDVEALLAVQGHITEADVQKLYKEVATTRFEPHTPRPPSDEADDDILAKLEESVRRAEAARAA